MNINISSRKERKDARFSVTWETDGNEEELKKLPKEVNVPYEIAEEGIDAVLNYLSDNYGWLIADITRIIT